MKLSIVIPAHNEEERLPPMLEQYAGFFSGQLGDEVEILVVVNGSQDQTRRVAETIALRYACVRVIDEPRKIGKGGAVVLGVQQAAGDWIGFVDADGATSASEYHRLFLRASGMDGVIGSRWIRGARVGVSQKGLRLLSSRLFNGLTRLMLGLRYRDTQCGAKIFTSKAWRMVLPHLGTTRYAFDVDLLYQLKRHGFGVAEEPTVWDDKAGSKVRVMSTSFEMFCAVVRMRLLYSPFRFLVKWYDRTLASPVEYLLNDRLFRHAAVLFCALMVTSIGNIGFQMVVGRVLSEAEYTLLATFLALFAIIARPMSTLSTGINHYTSLLEQAGRGDVVRRLLFKWLLLAGGVSVVISGICILMSPRIATFFHLERIAPVVLSAVAIPAIFVAPVVGGMLQGLQRFMWSAAAGMANAFGRVLLGALFVLAIYPACGWALAGHVGGLYFALLVSWLALVPLLKRRGADDSAVPSMRIYLVKCFFTQLAMGVLMTGDVVLVKHYLPENEGFAYAATLSRMVAFMAASVAMAMFPKVASDGVPATPVHRAVYLRSIIYTSCIVSVSLVVCLLLPALMLRVLFDIERPTSEILGYTRWMAVVMAISTLLNINVSLLMAQRRFRVLGVTGICALLYLGGVWWRHDSVWWVVGFAGGANVLALVFTSCGVFSGIALRRTEVGSSETGL